MTALRLPTRRLLATGAALAGALALAPGATATAVVPAPPAAPSAVPQRYAEQEIEWGPCFPSGPPAGLPAGSERLQCGEFLTPRDWESADEGVDLRISVSRLQPSTGPAGATVLTNPGGPGGPGLTLPLVYLAAERTRLTEGRDVVGIDVRGTGASTNATCAGAGSTLDQLDHRDRSEPSTTLILDVTELLARTCQSASGDLSPVISTEQTVQDLDLLRSLLGREQVDWIGYSAGTWLGAAYASAFPDRVGRFVLDANTEFTADWQASFENQPLGFERRFSLDFLPWAARYDGLYALGSTPEDVRAQYEALRADLADQPVPLLPNVDFGPAALDDLITTAMYSKQTFPDLAATLGMLATIVDDQLQLGEGAAAASAPALRSMLARMPEPASARPLAGDATDATFLHVACNDTPWQGDRASLLRESQEQGERFPLIGWETLSNPCVFWDRPERATLAPRTGDGVPPVLMVQNDKDPATPVEGALAAREAFAGARLLLVQDEGDHTVYPGNPCVDEKVEAYLLDGAPAQDSTCQGVGLPDPAPVAGPQEAAPAAPGAVGTPQQRAQHYAEAAPLLTE